jgi:hypothetical protein
MNHAKTAAALKTFLLRWLSRTVPDLQRVRVQRDGRVQARDSLGWRDVGTMDDFVSIARALGAIQA